MVFDAEASASMIVLAGTFSSITMKVKFINNRCIVILYYYSNAIVRVGLLITFT